MFSKVAFLAILAFASSASYSYEPVQAAEPEEPSHNIDYKMSLAIQDDPTYNYQTREESKDGDVVRGSYTVLEPTGELRIVKYIADHNGFQADVQNQANYGAPYKAPAAAPAYEAPKYEAPAAAPAYEAPKYEAPKYEAPAAAPAYEAPKYEAPAAAPAYEAPKYEAPAAAPAYEAPKYEAPAAAPAYEAPKYEAPAAAPAYEAPKYEAPAAAAPSYSDESSSHSLSGAAGASAHAHTLVAPIPSSQPAAPSTPVIHQAVVPTFFLTAPQPAAPKPVVFSAPKPILPIKLTFAAPKPVPTPTKFVFTAPQVNFAQQNSQHQQQGYSSYHEETSHHQEQQHQEQHGGY